MFSSLANSGGCTGAIVKKRDRLLISAFLLVNVRMRNERVIAMVWMVGFLLGRLLTFRHAH